MSKKYNGKDMAKASRFIDYLKTMTEVDLRKVEDKIDILIKENKEYCDKGNCKRGAEYYILLEQ